MSENPEVELISKLGDDFDRRRKAGEQPTIEEYTVQYPDLAEEIRDFFEAINIVKSLNHESLADAGVSAASSEKNKLPVIDDYRIVKEIARGGMGIVFQARQISLDRQVALKVLPNNLAMDETAKERFEREAKSAAALHHTNIVPVFDIGSQNGVCYYAMQLIHGRPLNRVIREIKRLKDPDGAPALDDVENTIAKSLWHRNSTPADASCEKSVNIASSEDTAGLLTANSDTKTDRNESDGSDLSWDSSAIDAQKTFYGRVARMGEQIADALQYAHDNGIFHRDIKPANLLLDLAGNAWVTDFGLAQTEDDGLTKTGDVVGTLRYMAPERFQGMCDERSDVYSLGVTMYEVVTQRSAFDSPDQLSLLNKIRNEDPPVMRSIDPTIPRDLQTIIAKATDKQPRRRYRTAADLAQDLARFADGRPIRARKTPPIERTWIWARRNPVVACLLTALVVVSLLTMVGSIYAVVAFRDMALVQNELTQEANELTKEAKASEVVAIESAKDLKRSLYQADMRLAQEALSGPGGMASARSRLEKWLPNNQDMDDYRGWEWYLLSSLVTREDHKFAGHWTNEVRFSRDGRLFGYARNGEIYVHEHDTKKLLRKIKAFGSRVYFLDFNHDGTRVAATAVLSGEVGVFDVTNGEQIAKRKFPNEVGKVRWSIDGTWLAFSASGAKDQNHSLYAWDLKTSQVKHYPELTTHVNKLDISPDGTTIGIFRDAHYKLVDTTTWKIIRKRKVSCRETTDLQFDPSGNRVAIAATRSGVIIWDLKDDSIDRLEARGVKACVTLAWDPTGQYLAAGNRQRSIQIWDTEKNLNVDEIIGSDERVKSVAWSPSGEFLLSTTHEAVRQWALDEPLAHQEIPGEPVTKAIAGVGRIHWKTPGMLVASGQDSSMVFRDEDLRMPPHRKQPVGTVLKNIGHCSYDRSGTWKAEVHGTNIKVIRVDGENESLEFQLDPNQLLEGVGYKLIDLTWSPVRPQLLFGATKGREKPVWIYHAAEKRLSEVALKHDDTRNLAWSPDGQSIVLSHHGPNNNDLVSVFDLQSQDYHLSVPTKKPGVQVVCASPDGTKIAYGGRSSVITVIDRETGETLQELAGHISAIISLDWSSDSKRLASSSGSGEARIWSVETGQCTLVLKAKSEVLGVGWDHRSDRLAAVTYKGTVHIWDASKAYELESKRSATSLAP